jgi:hypothetical protein
MAGIDGTAGIMGAAVGGLGVGGSADVAPGSSASS